MVPYFFGSLFNKTNTVYKLCMYWNRHLNIVTSMVSDVSGKKIKSIITYELWWVNGAPCTGESSNLVMVNQNLSDHDVLALLPVIEPWTKKTPNQGNTHLSQFGQTMVVFWTSGRPEVGPWAFFFWYEDCRFWNVVVWCCVLPMVSAAGTEYCKSRIWVILLHAFFLLLACICRSNQVKPTSSLVTYLSSPWTPCSEK